MATPLDRRAKSLADQGADPFRLELLARARRFKRSWVDMAEALVKLRVGGAYAEWGYADLYAYCAEELLLKRRTVDKLTGSYATLERHAPEVLGEPDERPTPTVDAVDYFRRAVENDGAPREKLDELREAVFDECRPVSAVRRQFHDELFPKDAGEQQQELLRRTQGSVRRLIDSLPDIDGLAATRRAAASAALTDLARDLERLMAASAAA